jgi:ribosome assembly protein SQT1
MNNLLRVWDVEKDFDLKFIVESGPTEDLNFVEWHPKGNAIMTGGKDFNIWLFNGNNGDYVNCFSGHEDEVLSAQFTLNDDGKHILSSSADKTIRLWSRT